MMQVLLGKSGVRVPGINQASPLIRRITLAFMLAAILYYRTECEIRVSVSDIPEKVHFVSFEQHSDRQRVHRRIPPPLIEEATRLV